MAERITVELSEADREQLAERVFAKIQEMMQTGDVPSYWVPKLLKLKQVAEILDFPLSKVHTKIKRGEIKCYRFDDKTLRVDPRDLYEYIQAHPNENVDHAALEEVVRESRALYATEH